MPEAVLLSNSSRGSFLVHSFQPSFFSQKPIAVSSGILMVALKEGSLGSEWLEVSPRIVPPELSKPTSQRLISLRYVRCLKGERQNVRLLHCFNPWLKARAWPASACVRMDVPEREEVGSNPAEQGAIRRGLVWRSPSKSKDLRPNLWESQFLFWQEVP